MGAPAAVFSVLPNRHLRPFDRKRDLNAVADLIELCFADTLDEDGRNYIKRMRFLSLQQNSNLPAWNEESIKLGGYVWEVDGQIVGNLTVQPYTGIFYPFDLKVMMIANVAVHPQYRRQGIARQLTQRALNDLRRLENVPIWLHVRADNRSAYNLYASLGFVEHFRRTLWVHESPLAMVDSENPYTAVTVKERTKKDWQQQKEWFLQTYPHEMWWYYAITPRLLQPGFVGLMCSLLSSINLFQWSVFLGEQLIGVAAWQPTAHTADYCWLMVEQDHEEQALSIVLPYLAYRVGSRKPFMVDYPVQRGAQVLQRLGFHQHQTLVWMSYC